MEAKRLEYVKVGLHFKGESWQHEFGSGANVRGRIRRVHDKHVRVEYKDLIKS